MLKFIALALLVATILPYGSASVLHHFSKSCYEVKEFLSANENGFYTLYDSNSSPYPTYCDFESDAPFIWTLIESLSLEQAQKDINREGFVNDHALSECHMTWSQFRLSKTRMETVRASYGTTHYRATCNFNSVNGTGLANRVDYVRGQICRNPYLFSSHSSYLCYYVDYINVRGQICRKCKVAHRVTTTVHNHIDLTATASSCGVTTFADAVTGEDVFGHYANPNPLFSCAANQASTTNWWLGGVWVAQSF